MKNKFSLTNLKRRFLSPVSGINIMFIIADYIVFVDVLYYFMSEDNIYDKYGHILFTDTWVMNSFC